MLKVEIFFIKHFLERLNLLAGITPFNWFAI